MMTATSNTGIPIPVHSGLSRSTGSAGSTDIAHAARIKMGVFMKMRGVMPYFRLPQAGNC